MGLIADQYYLTALKQNNIEYIRTAKTLFPFERSLLIGEAETYINNKVVSIESLESVKEALIYDPYSARLLSIQMQYAFIFKDNSLAVSSFYKLKELFPNMPIVKQLIDLGAK